MKAKKEANHLFSIVQHMGETVRSYSKWFNKEMLKVSNCHDLVAVQAFRRGLIHVRTPRNMVDVLQRVTKFIKLEDNRKLTRGEKPMERGDMYWEG